MERVTSDELEPKVLLASDPVVLDFYQATCPPCRALEPRLERMAEVYKGRMHVLRVDIEQDMPIAERFSVKSIPTVIFFRAGRELQGLDGLITDQQLQAVFEQVITSRDDARSKPP